MERKLLVLVAIVATVMSTYGALQIKQPVYETRVLMMHIEPSVDPSVAFLESYPQRKLGSESIKGHIEIIRSASSIERMRERLKEGYHMQFTTGQIRSAISLTSQLGSPIVGLAAVAGTPERAQALANVAASIYRQKLNEIKKADLIQAIVFLEQQMDSANKKLVAVESALNELKASSGEPGTSPTTPASRGQFGELQQLKADLSKIQLEIDSTSTQLASIQSTIAQAEETSTPSLNNVQNIQLRIAELQLRLDSMLGDFTEKDQEVMSLQRQIRVLNERLAQESAEERSRDTTNVSSLPELNELKRQTVLLSIQLDGLKQKESGLKKRIVIFNREHPDPITEQIELARLERQARVHDRTYMMLLENYEEMSLLKEMEMSRLQIIANAELPVYPKGLPKQFSLVLSGIFGVGLGIGLALLFAYLDSSIRNKEDVEKYFGLATIGVIPKIKSFKVPKGALWGIEKAYRRRMRKILSHILCFDPNITTPGKGSSGKLPVTTSYRRLAAQIGYGSIDTPVKTLLVTSAMPNDGKTTTSVNLAISLAQSGKKVLLIDADFGADQIHWIFKQQSSPGLVKFLVDEDASWGELHLKDSFIRPTNVDNLSIFPAGHVDGAQPEEILGSQKMEQLFKNLRDMYDIILFDSAPLLATAYTMILAAHVDATLLVVKRGVTKRQNGLQAIELLEGINVAILGVVLNEVNSSSHNYYSSP